MQPLDVSLLGNRAVGGDSGVEHADLGHRQRSDAGIHVTEDHRLQLLVDATDLVTARLRFHDDTHQVNGGGFHGVVSDQQADRVGRDAVRLLTSGDGDHRLRFSQLGHTATAAAFRRGGVDDRLLSLVAVDVAAGGDQAFPDGQDVAAVVAQGLGVQRLEDHLRVQQAGAQAVVAAIRAAEAVSGGHAGHLSHGQRRHAGARAIHQAGVGHHLVNRVAHAVVTADGLSAQILAQVHFLFGSVLVRLDANLQRLEYLLAVLDRVILQLEHIVILS
ncbi:hypothetical protein D3C86_1358270 [compost metagenome]